MQDMAGAPVCLGEEINLGSNWKGRRDLLGAAVFQAFRAGIMWNGPLGLSPPKKEEGEAAPIYPSPTAHLVPSWPLS